jgi:hypothetical protein
MLDYLFSAQFKQVHCCYMGSEKKGAYKEWEESHSNMLHFVKSGRLKAELRNMLPNEPDEQLPNILMCDKVGLPTTKFANFSIYV